MGLQTTAPGVLGCTGGRRGVAESRLLPAWRGLFGWPWRHRAGAPGCCCKLPGKGCRCAGGCGASAPLQPLEVGAGWEFALLAGGLGGQQEGAACPWTGTASTSLQLLCQSMGGGVLLMPGHVAGTGAVAVSGTLRVHVTVSPCQESPAPAQPGGGCARLCPQLCLWVRVAACFAALPLHTWVHPPPGGTSPPATVPLS